MLKTIFTKEQVVKVSMTYIYKKPEIKKKIDTTTMNTAANKACIEYLHGN